MRFSIITPVYNGERFIEKTIASVINQTYPEWEMIIINNGSIDNTKAKIEKFIEREPRIKLINCQENSGSPARPRNLGLKEARGEYIAFLDSDDIFFPEKLSRLRDFFINNPDVEVACHGEEHLKDNRIVRQVYYGPYTTYKDLLFRGNSLSTSAVAMKKSCIDKAGYFSENLKLSGFEDYDYWLKLAKVCKIRYLRKILGVYAINDNTECSKVALNCKNAINFLEGHYLEWPNKSLYYAYLFKKRKALSLRVSARELIRRGDFNNALPFLRSAIYDNPLDFKTWVFLILAITAKWPRKINLRLPWLKSQGLLWLILSGHYSSLPSRARFSGRECIKAQQVAAYSDAQDNQEVLKRALNEILCCPACKKDLELNNGQLLSCVYCQHKYAIKEGILVLMAPAAQMQTGEIKLREEAAKGHLLGLETGGILKIVAQHHCIPIMFQKAKKFRMQFSQSQWILDAGCGTAYYWRNAQGGSLIAMDFAFNNLKAAKKMLKDNKQVVFVQADASCLPIKKHALSGIWSVQVTQHFPNEIMGSFLEEIKRVTKETFFIELYNLNPAWLLRVFYRLFGKEFHLKGKWEGMVLNRLTSSELVAVWKNIFPHAYFKIGYSELFFHPDLHFKIQGSYIRFIEELFVRMPWLACFFARQIQVRISSQ